MYYVYRFVDKDDNIIYVGKSKQELEQRFRGHSHLPKKCYELVYKIEYIECLTESDMSIKEIYYINKYRNNDIFFNILDTTEVPISIEFCDKWKIYNGPLQEHFFNSVNYIEGYTTEKIIRYNKDGTVDKRKTNKEKGMSSFVEGFTKKEVELIIDYFINTINKAENSNQEQIRFRNLLMFVLGVNLPLKASEFLGLKVKDLLDENNKPKNFEFDLGRFHHDEKIYIPLRNTVCRILVAYTQKYGITYTENYNDELFQSRKHQTVSLISWGRILKDASVAVGINKNIGAESVRKTYGLNIYNSSIDKLNALRFLGEIWGSVREAKIINYLGLSNDEVAYDYYLGEEFSLGDVDLTTINCLKTNITPTFNMYKKDAESKIETDTTDEKCKTTNIIDNIKPKKTNREWSKEQKIKIVKECLIQNVPQKQIAEKYNIDTGAISRWVSAYKKFGADGLQDKRRKN